jgi:hypothetical protein
VIMRVELSSFGFGRKTRRQPGVVCPAFLIDLLPF